MQHKYQKFEYNIRKLVTQYSFKKFLCEPMEHELSGGTSFIILK